MNGHMKTHNIPTKEEYDTQLFSFLSAREGFVDLGVYVDSLGILTFGYGLAGVADARGKSGNEQLLYAKGIFADLIKQSTAAKDISAAAYWQVFYDALNDTNKIGAFRALPKATNEDIAKIFGNITMDTIHAKTLYDRVIQDYEKCVDIMFPTFYPLGMLRSQERIALVSLSYNRGEYNLIHKSPDLLSALQVGNRFEVWWQMLFNQAGSNSVGDRDTFVGIINRRIEEANMFGLYDEYDENNSPTSIDEVRHIIQQFKDKLNNTDACGLMNQYFDIMKVNNDKNKLIQAVNNSIRKGVELIVSQQVLNLSSGSSPDSDIKNKFNEMLSKFTKNILKLDASFQIDMDNSAIFNIFIREGAGTGDEYFNTDGVAFSSSTEMTGTTKADLIIGTSGLERIDGGDGDDIIVANIQNTNAVTINGGSGNDFIIGTSHGETIDGGDGDDIIIEISGINTINGAKGNDTIYGGKLFDRIDGGEGDDILYGGDGIDVIDGSEGNDEIYGDDGTDLLDGGVGDDKIYGGKGADRINGGDGNDEIYGGEDSDVIFGDDGNDHIYGNDGNDSIIGGNGNDILRGGDGDDNIDGGDGDDTIYGNAGDDILYGGNGSDKIYGLYGDSLLLVGGTADFTLDDNASDILMSVKGNETYVVGNGDKIIDRDGIGTVLFNGVSVSARVSQQKNGKYEHNGYRYTLNGNILTITEISSNKSIHIESKNNASSDEITYESLGIILTPYQKQGCPCGCGCEEDCGCDPTPPGGDDEGTTTNPPDGDGGTTTNPDDGDGTTTPDEDGNTPGGSTGDGGTTTNPDDGDGTTTPDRDGSNPKPGDDKPTLPDDKPTKPGGCDCGCNNKPKDDDNDDGGTDGDDNGKPHQSPIILNLDGTLANDTILLEDSNTYFDIKNRGFGNRTDIFLS